VSDWGSLIPFNFAKEINLWRDNASRFEGKSLFSA